MNMLMNNRVQTTLFYERDTCSNEFDVDQDAKITFNYF